MFDFYSLLPQGELGTNRIFYLSVPQGALLDVASSLADCAQSRKGWNRIIIEKPFGSDLQSSHQLTQSLLSKFKENQLYRSAYVYLHVLKHDVKIIQNLSRHLFYCFCL